MYKFFLYAPRDTEVITKIIDAASKAGAGTIGNYTHCAFVTEGYGTWLPREGSNPVIGKVGELSKEDEVRIEMECPKEKMQAIFEAVRKVHPYEKFAIDAVSMEIFE
ncbi:MAG TPA: hypothetical protein VLF89_03100 [Candidatus Saccharimonadales bacterium]|nr:hypothetical protein [Candidatus Saccharimonadales bacterium]